MCRRNIYTEEQDIMGIPVEGVDPPESQPEVGVSGVGELGRAWKSRGDQVTAIGHRTLALQIAGEGTFPTSLRKSLDALAQACTTQGASLTEAGKAAIKQGSHEETFQEQYRLATASLTKAVAAKQQALAIAAQGGSSAYMVSAQSAETQARAGRKLVLDNGVAGTQMNLDCLPGHARDATESVGKAQSQLTLQTGFEPSATNNVAPVQAPSAPAPRVETGGNAKPSRNTPSKPSAEKPDSANKNSVDDKGQTPTGTQPQNQQAQLPQQSPQQGAPQGGAQAAPAAGAPAGGQQGAKPTGIGGVPTPVAQPIRTPDSGNRGGGVRPSTPPTPQGNNSPVTGKGGGVIGSGAGGGSTASPAGGQQANKAGGGIGSGAGGGTTSGTSGSGMRPMGGMMGAAGAGHNAGGTARPKGEVKSTDPKMSAEDIASQALGGIVKDGDDGRPVPPPAPGSTGDAPTPPPIPPKP